MLRTLTGLALLLGSLDLCAAITGFVIDETGKPIAGARVRAFALESSDAATARLLSDTPEPTPVASAQTDDKGAFRIEAKQQPVVTLVVDAPGRALFTDDVADGTNTGAFLLRKAAAKQGRITASGRPVAGALVVINSVYFARTNERGEYTTPDPAAWNASALTVIHRDFATTLRSRGRDPLSLDVALESGTAAGGRVIDEGGVPVANAVIRGAAWPLAKSKEDGTFAIAHLPAEVSVLRAFEGTRTGAAKPSNVTTIVLRPGATLTGTVRSNKDGAAVAGMKLSVRGEPSTQFARTVITDAKGAFTIDAIPPGLISIPFLHPLFYGNTPDVTLGERTRTERSITVAPYGRIAGTVVDEDKRAVAGARVGFSGTSVNSLTAPDGTFTVRVPPLGRSISLDVAKESYAEVTHGLDLEPGEARTGVRIVLPRGTRFEVRLVDTSNVAIANEPVMVSRRDDTSRRPRFHPVRCGESECRTDAEGKVGINIVEGPYNVAAGGDTTVMKELGSQTLSAATSPLVIELERGALIEGRVVYSDGTPITGSAQVFVEGTPGASAPVSDGAFTLRNAPAGKVLLAVRGMYPQMSETDPVEVTAPASGVVLKVPRPGRIEGRVVDKETQRGVPQFTVATQTSVGRRGGNTSRAFTAEDGRFVLENVPEGTYDVIVTASGYARASWNAIEVIEGNAARADFSLERGATVVGRVTSGGQPVGGAGITTTESRGRRPQIKYTDPNGEFVLDTLTPGPQELSVQKTGFVTQHVSVNAAAGKETRTDVELSRGRELSGRVIDASGQPVAGAMVSQRPAGAQRSFSYAPATTDADGRFELEGLGDAPVIVSAQKDGYAEAALEVNPATSTTVVLTLGRGGSLSGRVTGLSPQELTFVEIQAMGRGPGSARAMADATGAFTIHGLDDGEVTLTAQETRPPRRQVRSRPLTITGGTAPFVELDFAAGLVVRGHVTKNGQPTRGLIIFTSTDPRDRSRNAVAELSGDGSYEARVPVAGDYRVLVTPSGGMGTIETGTVSVQSDRQHDVDVRGTMLRGRVVDATTGQPVGDVRVELRSANRGTDRTTDSSGRFAFEFVTDGPHTLSASLEGYSPDTRQVMVQNGVAPETELALGRGELVEVQVVDAGTGQPVEAFVALTGGGPATRAAGGIYRFWLRPGTYAVRVVAQGYQPKPVEITVPGLPRVRVELARAPR